MLNIIKQNDVVVARFQNVNRFNSAISQSVKDELLPFVSGKDLKLVIDLEDIVFIDSSAFGTLIALLRVSKTTNSKIRLCNLTNEVKEEISVMQLDTVFDIRGSFDDCISDF